MNPLLIGALALAGIYLLNNASGLLAASKHLKADVTMPTRFRIEGMVVKLRFNVEIKNYFNTPIPVDTLIITCERKAGDSWVEFTSSDPALSSNLVIGARGTTVIPVEMQASLAGAIYDLFQVSTTAGTKQIRVKVVPVIKGFEIEPVIKTFSI